MALSRQDLLSRHGFCVCGMTAGKHIATGSRPTPSQVFAEAHSLVQLIKSEAAKTPITIHRVGRDIAVLEGSGGNIAVLLGPDGKLLVDAGIAVSRPQIATALAALSTDPVARLVNTHWHFDHANGNEWLHSVGARILAHENTRKLLSMAQRVEDWDFDFPAASAAALPSEVFATEQTIRHNGTTIALKYYGPAHTDGDISVHFAEVDVLHAGDIFWNGIYPFIDYSTGGSIDGTIRAADAVLAAVSDTTVIIPGHGQPVSNRSQLQEFRDMLADIRDYVAALKQQGKSLEDIVAARPTAAYDAKWGNFVISPTLFTGLVWEGV
jgi:glyoxylase-like metal-dependent hydrolase (beta-lactamase superfamily II)